MEKLREYAAMYGIVLTEEMLKKFSRYMQELLQWNQRMNLTAITDKADIVIKHFLDSLLLLDAVPIPNDARVLDVGAGAGFPGLPLKIARPDISLTMLDSLQKRVLFLQEISKAFSQNNECIHGRAEDFGHVEGFRGQYDLVTARAVAALPVLLEYCLPFAAVGGVFAAMKGPSADGEIHDTANAMTLLGANLVDEKCYELPNGDRRTIIIFQKVSQTSPKYPRTAGKISKSPL